MSHRNDIEPAKLTYAVFPDALSAQWAVEELVEMGFRKEEIRVLVRDANVGLPEVQALPVEGESQAWLGLATGTTVGVIAGGGLTISSPWALVGSATPWILDAAMIGAFVGSVIGLFVGMLMFRHIIEKSGLRFTPAAYLVGVRTRGDGIYRARQALRSIGAPVVFEKTPRAAHSDFHNPRFGEALRSLEMLTSGCSTPPRVSSARTSSGR